LCPHFNKDSLCHPLFDSNPGFVLVDGILHGLVEQNPSLTFRKFIRHNLPKLIDKAEKGLERGVRVKYRLNENKGNHIRDSLTRVGSMLEGTVNTGSGTWRELLFLRGASSLRGPADGSRSLKERPLYLL